MKKFYLFVCLALFALACTENDISNVITLKKDDNSKSSIRSFDEALEIAQASIVMVDGQAKTRAASPRKIALSESKVYKLDAKTRTSSEMNDTLMYVFNFENNQGFAIISANRNAEALIAVTEKGYYDPDIPSEVEGFNFYIEMAKEYLRLWPIDPIDPDSIYRDSIVIAPDYSLEVGPYVSVAWGQFSPEGELCPNGISGCTNTALAQIMSYYEYPASINITYNNTPYVENLNWSLMKSHVTQHPYSNCSSQTTHMSISQLHRQLGHLNNSQYAYNHTGTNSTVYAKGTMQGLGYQTGDWNSYDIALAMNHLNANHLLLMIGNVNSGGGHAWLSDGYLPYRQYVYRLEPIGIDGAWVVTNVTPGTVVLYRCHMNWGWYGVYNGYFSTVFFNLNSPEFGNNIQINNVSCLPIYHVSN